MTLLKTDALPSVDSTRVARRGMALLIVMVLTMLLALAAYRFSFYMESQYRVTRIAEEQAQARLAALSGIEIAAALLELAPLQRQSLGGLHDNATLFQSVAIEGDDAAGSGMNAVANRNSTAPDSNSSTNSQSGVASRSVSATGAQGTVGSTWRVSLVAPLGDSNASTTGTFAPTASRSPVNASDASGRASAPIRFGLVNESAKLHIPTLLKWEQLNPGNTRMALLRLPGATETMVDAWLQRQGVSLASNSAGGGSELRERLSLQGNRRQLQSANEWLKYQWLGGDLNQNFLLDPLESQLAARLFADQEGASAANLPNSNASSAADASGGWQRFLTWDSGVRNESATGQPRVNLNARDLVQLHRDLTQVWSLEWANFVIAVRQFGISAEQPAESLSAASWTPDFGKPATYPLTSLTELLEVQVVVPNGSGKQRLQSPFSSDLSGTSNYLDRLLDESTLEMDSALVGRVDLADAPVEVLAAVPGVDLALAQNIVQRRAAQNTDTGRSIAWLLQEKLVTPQQLQSLESYLTSRSDVYSLQAVGFRDGRTPVYRCSVTVDARLIPARILHHQTWHTWDRGFSIESLSGKALTL